VLTDFPVEHDVDAESDTPSSVPLDAAAAVPPFTPAERGTVAQPLLSARASADAAAWNRRMYPTVSGVTLDEIRSALRNYVDPAAVQKAIDASSPDTDGVFVECVHQFQMKCYRDRREHDGRTGESTLDSLGFIVRSGAGFRGADRGNATAQQRLRSDRIEPQIGTLTSHEFSAANWFDAMADPSVFGWRTKSGTGLHVVLVRRLRQAERYLLTLPAFRGMTPAALGAALGVAKPHGGVRPSQTGSLSMHTFGLAIDIAYRTNPWIHDAASWRAIQRAAALLSDTDLKHDTAPEYFASLGADRARSTEQIWDELQRRNNELIAYLRLAQDPPALRAALTAGQARGTAGLVEPEETAHQATARWQARIEQDRQSLAGGDFRNHEPPGKGFLNLPRDLVVALRDHGCLAWGAVHLGRGHGAAGT
jgi:hypothetical protein